jgi:ribosome biogenesis protein Tsr3
MIANTTTTLHMKKDNKTLGKGKTLHKAIQRLQKTMVSKPNVIITPNNIAALSNEDTEVMKWLKTGWKS